MRPLSFWLLISIYGLTSSAIVISKHSDEYDHINKQISALIDRRKEDLKLIQDGIIENVLRDPEILNIRNEIDFLKFKIGSTLNRKEDDNDNDNNNNDNNVEKEVEWMTVSINEIKKQLNEIQNTLNSTVIIQNHQEIDAELSVMRNDVSNLLRDFMGHRGSMGSLEAKFSQLADELVSVRNDSRKTALLCGYVQNKINIMETENNYDPQKTLIRHGRQLKKRTEPTTETNVPLYVRFNGDNVEKYRLINEEQFKIVNQKQVEFDQKLVKIHNKLHDFEKMHFSMLELLENMEHLESEVEENEPKYRKEISKIDFNVDKISLFVKELKTNDLRRNNDLETFRQSLQNIQKQLENEDDKFQQMKLKFNTIENALRERNQNLHNHILKTESINNQIGLFSNTDAVRTTTIPPLPATTTKKEYNSLINKLPRDCKSVEGPSGIYLILPDDHQEPVLVKCDNGWTLIQKRIDGSVDFNRNWSEYSNGFGVISAEHWLGNRNVHLLTKDNCSMLEIHMIDIYGTRWNASYRSFLIGDYSTGYKLEISGYYGNASDAMNYQNLMEFSTVDNDRDISNTHCASNYEGGWWFSHCQHANLNGKYNLGLTWFDSSKNQWIAVANSEMRIRRREIC